MTIKLTRTFTEQELNAIITGLRVAGEAFVQHKSEFGKLADELAADVAAANKKIDSFQDTESLKSNIDDFKRFAPTAGQIAFASQWAAERRFDSVFVSVNFPGKEHGIWNFGQVREPVMDGDEPVFWTDRNVAMTALRTGKFGNAIFRVYADGQVGAAIENI